jgi:Bax protein
MQKHNGSITVLSATTQETEDLFKQYDYEDYSKTEAQIPRIYLTKLPTDWADVPDSHDKHRTFIRIMLPLVLKVNEAILTEREPLEEIQKRIKDGKQTTDADVALVEKYAEKYDVFVRDNSPVRPKLLLQQLLEKVDQLPPSIMVVSAGIYSNWGTSRLALEANNLYRTEIWYKNEGMKPLDDANASYRYKIFANLAEAVSERAHLLNSHINYDYVRLARKQARKMGVPPYSSQLVAQMLHDSNLKNIAGIIDYTFSYYKLGRTDFMPELRSVK